MQNPLSSGQNTTQLSPEKSSENLQTLRQKALQEVPVALLNTGMVSIEDWALFDEETKLQLLENIGINPEEYVAKQIELLSVENSPIQEVPQTIEGSMLPPVELPSGDSAISTNIEQASDAASQLKSQEKEYEDIKKQFNEIKAGIEKNEAETARTLKNFPSPEEVAEKMKADALAKLQAEDKAQIQTEKGANFNNMTMPKVSGYAPSTQLLTNSDDVSKNGSVSSGNTWVATLLQKIWLSLR